MNNQRILDNHGNITQDGDIFDLKSSNIGNMFLNIPFNKDIITNDKQLINLKFFPNSKYYNFIKIFNRLLTLCYVLFVIYFIINQKPDTNLIFFKTTMFITIYCFIYNVLGLKLIITKDFIEFKNKKLYFKEIRKMDFNNEYRFVEIYIKGEFRKNKLDNIYPDVIIYFDNKYRAKAVEDYWEKYKSKKMEAEVKKNLE
ncbi:hypothetical protein [Aliarcobacter butzleri]|uniref:hypothetical protein n=1 Tax=Aliarcobacter butzleri TaxID=28197 RepID=UPI0018A0D139|nr:hypothetical protein [Aliarcobacter butzleri]MBF7071339.1 hypothetical protein [Aliarcobacter butzleri]